MKLTKKFLSVIPFVLVAFSYYKFYDPDNVGHGLAHIMIAFFFILLFIITIVIAFRGVFGNRQSEKYKADPIALSIMLLTILILIYSWTFRGHTNGKKWIIAENKIGNNSLSSLNLILRKNGNFTINSNYVDFGSSISGKYEKRKDTIFLDKFALDKIDSEMKTAYLLTSTELIPLFDTTTKWVFKITEIK